jgi:protein O-mannosyl-transferase
MSAPDVSWFESRGARRWGALVAALAGIVAYSNAIWGDFVYDDKVIVRDNPRIREITNFSAIWLSDWWQPQTDEQWIENRHRDRLYRPLTMFTFAVNYSLHDLRPRLFLATNVLLHAASCALVFLFVLRLLERGAAAWLTALIFAVHPVHCEAVANVVGRAEVLSTLLILSGMLMIMPRAAPPSWKRVSAAALVFFAALMAKETAVSYLAAAGIVLWMRIPAADRKRVLMRTISILAVPLFVYFPLRFHALGGHLIRDMTPSDLSNPLSGADWLYRIVGPFQILGHYVRLLLLPAVLSSDYGANVVPPNLTADPLPFAMTLLGFCAAATLAWALAGLRRGAGARREVAFVALIFLASYALISNTVLLIGIAVAERIFYWPSVSALLLISMTVIAAWRRWVQPASWAHELRRAGMYAVCAWCAVLGVRTLLRNLDWRSNETLFDADVVTFPQSATLNMHEATALLNAALDLPEGPNRRIAMAAAEQHAIISERLYPPNPRTLLLRGRIRVALGDREGAIRLLETGVNLLFIDIEAKRILHALVFSGEEWEQRLAGLRAAVAAAPNDAAPHGALGEALLQAGQVAQALIEFEAAERLAPNDADMQRLLGEALIANNEQEKAREHLKRAIELNPNEWRAYSNLAALEEDRGKALEFAERAYRLRPDSVQANVNYAERLFLAGRQPEAVRQYRQLIRSLPADSLMLPALKHRLEEIERRG